MHCSNVAATPVQVSIDRDLLRRIDADPEARENGRSAFIRAAVRHYLAAKERRALEARLLPAYEGEADATLEEVADIIGTQEWPES